MEWLVKMIYIYAILLGVAALIMVSVNPVVHLHWGLFAYYLIVIWVGLVARISSVLDDD